MTAAGLAARLRLLQMDCADLPAAARREYIREEIARALEGMPAEKKGAFLESLAGKFPAWDTAPSPEGFGISAAGDIQERRRELLEAIQSLPPESKREFFKKLMAEAGLEPEQQDASGWAVPPDLRNELGLAPDQSPAPENALRLLAMLLGEFGKLESLTWEMWSRLAPRSAVRRELPPGGDFKSWFEPCLRGEAEAAALAAVLEKTRKLMAGLLAAIPLGGKAFAEEYLVRFLPQNIEDVVHSRGVSLFGDSMEKKCWNKYKELAHLDVESIEKKIRDAIAQQAEELAKKA